MEKIIDASFIVLNVIGNGALTESEIIEKYVAFSYLSKPVLNINLFFENIKFFLISKGLIECFIVESDIRYKLTDYGKKVLLESMKEII